MHTNQTDRFKVASSTGNNCIIVLYDSVSNSSILLVELMRNRTGTRILSAKILPARLVAAGLQPRLQCLDIKCFKMLTRRKMFLTKETAIINIQLAPPAYYIETMPSNVLFTRPSKNVFIADLCSIRTTGS